MWKFMASANLWYATISNEMTTSQSQLGAFTGMRRCWDDSACADVWCPSPSRLSPSSQPPALYQADPGTPHLVSRYLATSAPRCSQTGFPSHHLPMHTTSSDNEKKCSEEMQTLHAGCSKVEPKFFAHTADPLPRGIRQPKFNQLEMVTTFTYEPSLMRIDVRNFELSW